MKKEIELKYGFASKSDFDLFFSFVKPIALGKAGSYRQENFYFDTPSFHLKREGISLRLRKENSRYLICAKQSFNKKRVNKNLSVRLEYEFEIRKELAELIRQGYLSPVDAFSSDDYLVLEDLSTKKVILNNIKKACELGVQLIGSFKNHRTVLPVLILGHHIDLQFDQISFPKSIESFEVEIEFCSEKQADLLRPALEDLFSAAQIKIYKASSKSSRLYEILFG